MLLMSETFVMEVKTIILGANGYTDCFTIILSSPTVDLEEDL